MRRRWDWHAWQLFVACLPPLGMPCSSCPIRSRSSVPALLTTPRVRCSRFGARGIREEGDGREGGLATERGWRPPAYTLQSKACGMCSWNAWCRERARGELRAVRRRSAPAKSLLCRTRWASRARAPDGNVAWSLKHDRKCRFSPGWGRWRGPWPRWWNRASPRAGVRCPAPCSLLRGKARAADTHQAPWTGCTLQATLPRWQGARSRCGRLMPAPPHAQLRLARQAQPTCGLVQAPSILGHRLTPGQALPAHAALQAERLCTRPRGCILHLGAVAVALAMQRVGAGMRARKAARSQLTDGVGRKRALINWALQEWRQEAGMRRPPNLDHSI